MLYLKRYTYLLLILLACLDAIGQRNIEGVKIPIDFYQLENEIPAGEIMHVYLKGEEEVLHSIANEHGWIFKRYTGRYAAVAIPKNELSHLESMDEVKAVHFQLGQGKTMLNESHVNTRIDRVHAGLAGLPNELDGEGVIIGVIDAGIDLNHPDFLDENGKTRVLNLWDQNLPANEIPRIPVYGYGQVYDSADINDSLCPHQDQAIWYGHGTNTNGIAAANGDFDEQYTGCAPAADIIVVSSNFFSFSWTSLVADAVHYIFARAEEHGRPCVINASIGSYFGSHDGNDLATKEIESFIADDAGRIMVCAAGNSGENDPYHLGYSANSDTSFTWFRIPSNATSGNGMIRFDVYGDTGDFEGLKFSIGADRVNPSFKFEGQVPFDSIESLINTSVSYNLVSNSGNYLGEVTYWGEEFNGTYRLVIQVSNIDSVGYRYGLHTTGTGRLDIWSSSSSGLGGNSSDIYFDELPSVNQYPRMLNYIEPDYEQQIVSNWACSDYVITVGNYTNRNEYVDVDETTVTYNLTPGEIASSSSSGPSRLGSIKPDVAAPGELTLTSGAAFQIQSQLNNNQRDRVGVGGMHNRAGGTSSASPVVAGIAALFLQHCPNSDWEDFKEALTSDAVVDQYTGSAPNDTWGHGKADAINTLKYLSPNSTLNENVKEFCEGETVELSLGTVWTYSQWNTGQLSTSIEVSQGGIYYALLKNDIGCTSFSDSATLIKRPIPQIPVIEILGKIPACANDGVTLAITEEHGSYEWSTGDLTSSVFVNEPDAISCTVSNEFGCSNHSETIDVQFYPQRTNPQLIVQQDDQISMLKDTLPVVEYRWYLDDVQIVGASDSILQANKVGAYRAAFIDDNGCEWMSEELQLAILGLEYTAPEKFEIYPNPTTGLLKIKADASCELWQLYSISGSLISQGVLVKGDQVINVSDVSNGVYLLKLQMPVGPQFVKIIKH